MYVIYSSRTKSCHGNCDLKLLIVFHEFIFKQFVEIDARV